MSTSSPRRRPRLLLAGSLTYLGVMFGVMLWRGIAIEPQWVVLALLVVAAALGRARTFIGDWIPFLILFLGYEEMRGFAAKTGFAPHDLSGAERLLFGGRIPTLDLQHAFYRADVISAQDWVSMVLYFMHFVLPIGVGFIFWINSREHFRRYVAALLVLCLLAFITYLFYPSAPPWYQLHDVVKINDQTIAKWGVSYFVSPVYDSFNPNRFAAFPSLHAAFPALAAMYAWSRYRLLSIALIAWSVAVWIAIVYLGEHYFVDAVAGVVYVLVASALVEVAFRWLSDHPVSLAKRSKPSA